MLTQNTHSDKIYLNIQDGLLVKKASKDTEGAVKVTYVDKKTGEEIEKWRMEWRALAGIVQNLSYSESEFDGKVIKSFNLEIDGCSVSVQLDSPYFQDFAEKLLSVDLSKEIKIAPYDFISKKTGKRKRGITILQNDEKVKSKFYVENGQPKPEGYPEADEEKKAKMGKAYWTIYYAELKFFLASKLQELIASKFGSGVKEPEIEEVSFEDMAKPAKKSTKKAYDGSDLPPAIEPEGPLPWEVDAN